jgi:hypothetical protein
MFPVSLNDMPYGARRLLWNYSNTALVAGTNTLDIFTAGADMVEYHKRVSFQYVGTVTNVTVTIGILWGGTFYPFITFAGLVSGRWYEWVIEQWMYDADIIRVVIAAATAGNDFAANGYYLRYPVER